MGNFEEVENRLFKTFNVTKAKELAEILEVSQSTYGNWRQRNKIPYDEIITICVKMNIDVNFILTGKEKEEIEKKINFKDEILQIIENSDEKELEYFYYLLKAETTKK